MLTRRTFIKSSALAASASTLSRSTLGASLAHLVDDTPASEKKTIRLSSGWEFLREPLGGLWEVWHSKEIATWQAIEMPHCFNAYDGCDPDVPAYRGNGWYRLHLPVANPYPNGRTLLHFEGAGQATTVYVGNTPVGHHVGGYDEFIFDITDAVEQHRSTSHSNGQQKGPEVPIAVLCDNSRDLDRMPSDLSDFTLYGGLYRHVNLVYVPAVSLEQLHVKVDLPRADSSAEVRIVGTVYNPAGNTTPITLALEIVSSDGKTIHTERVTKMPWPGEALLSRFVLNKPQRWSPSTPLLYQCRVTVTTSAGEYTAHETFGVRHTEWVDHGPFKLNGERLLLRGTHRHEDHAGYAAAMPDDLIEQEMTLIKEMGVNFIRLAHYQQSRRVVELCDRLGILVWEEVPWCRAGIGGETFQEMGRRTLRNMIAQHFNHPSILLWGLGNEDDWPTEYPEVNHEKIRAYLTELRDLSHQLDPSRITTIRRCDFARDIPDVYSPSIWAGWYSGTYTEYQKSLETQRERVKHLFHAEWGADSHAGRHSESPDKVLAEIATGHGTDERGLAYLNTGGEARVSRDGDWSETYACNLFDWHLKVQETLPWFTGSAQWVFKDFTTPLRVENPVPRVNQKGVVTRDMQKKESYYVFQSYWTDQPMAHIYGHSWPIRWGAIGEKKMVKVYSNCETAELFVNGVSAGIRRRDSQNFPAAGLRWMVAFVDGANKLRVEASQGSTTISDEIEFLYETRSWGPPTTLKLAEVHRTDNNVTVEATLHDAKSILCLDARNRVRFTIAGDGRLIDNLGTPTGSRVVELSNGRARIRIAHSRPGQAAVAVKADGISAALLQFS
ncbi:glycoside hydrolase family 2 TIM barrel-domain containing protein [Edaphobacter sp. 12200R-103]|uniref:glycoside hydrolase family 2 protein n=1 Tax=Edaphobacter sp. 12200R-103 TaxID=2703788 RepID=UPI00138C9C97|nr:glycoside hydrolase family 2 TIM barrel-domain containing protein [Edaphobacter sp. 12200R-103]QHS51318.1 glycoside hydrolase family 2 protein [Edaphobacter sp. 12200R-103]